MRAWRWVFACLVVHAAILGANAASAQTDLARERSREEFSAGVAALDDRRPRDALESFRRAYALFPHYATLFNIGLCERELGHSHAAAVAFRHYLDRGGDALDPAQREKARRLLAESEAKIAHLVLEVDASAEVRIDGRLTEERAVELDAGEHVVEASAPSRTPIRRTVARRAGERQSLRLHFTDHAATSMAPAPAPPASEARRSRIAFWTFAGIGAAALVAGTAFGAVALSDSSAYRDPSTSEADAEERRTRGESFRVVADVSFGVAILSGLAAILTY
jgi:hypothetical protein